MSSRLVLAPRWLLSILAGVFFGCGELVITGITTDGDRIGALVGAVVGGALFGWVLGGLWAEQNRRVQALADLDDRDELLSAVRAVRHGQAPADPRIRSAAARIVLDRLREVEGQYRLTVGILAFGGLVFLAMALLLSPWWLIAAAVLAGAAAQAFYLPTRLARRVVLLGSPEDESASLDQAS